MKPLSILLVEDDKLQRLKFKIASDQSQSDSEIVEANNGQKALQILRNNKHHFDLIISDLNMPIMNGIELLKSIRTISTIQNIPVVIMSTSTMEDNLQTCYDLGISGYFNKPSKFSEYFENVRVLLEYWSKSIV